MIQLWKRLTSLVLSLSCIFALCCPVSASAYSSNAQEDGYLYYNHSNEYSLSATEADMYSCFEVSRNINEEVALANDVSMKEYILSLCTLSAENYFSEIQVKSYESETLQEALYECDRIGEITLIGEVLYVTYFTTSGIEVRLGYNNAGLTEKVVYYPETDTAIIQNMGVTTRCDGFRAGCSSEISDELLAEIDRLIEEQNWDTLNDLECVDWESENPVAESSSMLSTPRAGGAFGFTSDAQMLANLKADFPMKTDAVLYNQSKYTSILAKNYTVKVLEDRNGYVRKTSEWKNFIASTALTAIGAYLSVTTAGTITILDALGIGMAIVDGVNQILESVTLYRSAKYKYLGARDGYVLDDTVYNKFVHVIYHSGYGEFTGGYSSSGVFTWVESGRSSAYDHSASSIADKALEYYAKNVYADGYCSAYWPD